FAHSLPRSQANTSCLYRRRGYSPWPHGGPKYLEAGGGMGRGKLIALSLLGIAASLASSGCFSSGCSYLLPGESLIDDLTDPKPPPLTRLQQAEPPPELKVKAQSVSLPPAPMQPGPSNPPPLSKPPAVKTMPPAGAP